MPNSRGHVRLVAVAGLAAAALAAAPAEASASCAGSSANVRQASNTKLVRSTLCLLNVERRKRGLRKMRLSKKLSQAARKHSRDMVRRDYFSHTSLSGASFVDRIRRSGYLRGANTWAIGENLAWGSGSRSSPGQTVRAWMRSPGHKHNILTRRYVHVGIGIAPGAPARVGSRPAATYTTDFGFKR